MLQKLTKCVTIIYIRRKQAVPEEIPMYTTTDEHGILNNFAAEPKLSYAASPSGEQKRAYLIQGVVAAVLVVAAVSISLGVS